MTSSTVLRSLVIAAAVSLTACAPGTEPTSLGDDFLKIRASSASVGSSAVGEICKYGPEGTTATFTVSVSGAQGTLPLGSEFTLPAYPTANNGYNCRVIFVPADTGDGPAQNSVLTVTEIGASAGMHLVHAVANSLDGYFIYENPTTSSFSLTMNWNYGAVIRFKNEYQPVPPPPPSTGSQGCTPGYWKQQHHFDSWVGYSPNQPFGTVFANAFPNKSLLDILKLGGGGLNALGRHTVAALLSASSTGVDYGMTPEQVIAEFNAAYAAKDHNPLKDKFEGFNERGCPLN